MQRLSPRLLRRRRAQEVDDPPFGVVELDRDLVTEGGLVRLTGVAGTGEAVRAARFTSARNGWTGLRSKPCFAGESTAQADDLTFGQR
ncbi:hypothetical protein [Polymorphospora rubra]|nr:hypothetical protein [Polymorphospora rubra]